MGLDNLIKVNLVNQGLSMAALIAKVKMVGVPIHSNPETIVISDSKILHPVLMREVEDCAMQSLLT